MVSPTGFRGILGVLFAVWTLGGLAAAQPLRLVTSRLLPFQDIDNEQLPGFSVEVLRQVLAAMGQDASFESIPWDRSWRMMLRGERDGMATVRRTNERERICFFPDEPLKREKWVLFVRTADVARLQFSSFNDLAGYDVAVHAPVPGVLAEPTVSSELESFLHEHHNMIETSGPTESIRLLAAGRVGYALMNLTTGKQYTATMGLSGKIEPILSRSVIEDDLSVCFSKARVAPSQAKAFSHALKAFKQTEAFQAIYRKYFP
jgi:polar amino acid transport system substrate-binding protein